MPLAVRRAMGARGRDYGRHEFDRDRLVGWLAEATAENTPRRAQ
jgi:hypothetical protein